jgi:hypothetical protein
MARTQDIRRELRVQFELWENFGTLGMGMFQLAQERVKDLFAHKFIQRSNGQFEWPMPTAKRIVESSSASASYLRLADITSGDCAYCGQSNRYCTCDTCSSGSIGRYTDTVTLSDGTVFNVQFLGAGVETNAYAIDGSDDVLLCTCVDSVDKDIMAELYAQGYAHTIRVERIGMTADGRRKVYRAERVAGVGIDADGIAAMIRLYFDKYDLLTSYRRMVRNGVPKSAVKTLYRMLKLYRSYGMEPGLDLHRGNYATDSNGRFILLDPFYRG